MDVVSIVLACAVILLSILGAHTYLRLVALERSVRFIAREFDDFSKQQRNFRR